MNTEKRWADTVFPMPPARLPIRVFDAPKVRGERIILQNNKGNHYRFRGWAEIYTRVVPNVPDSWAPTIEVVTERVWWEFQLNRKMPRPDDITQWPARFAWVE